MTIETATYIASLVATNPAGGDAKNEGDNHIRLIKAAILATFPNFTGAVTGSHLDVLKNHWTGGAAPTINDDSGDGYSVGSWWIDSSNNVYICLSNTLGAAVWQSLVPVSALSANRNRLINGDMRIDQRNAGNSLAIVSGAGLAFTVDRWFAYCSGASLNAQRVAGSGNTRYRYRFTGAASVTGIKFGQRIEIADSYDLAGQAVTLGVDLANSLLTSVSWALYYANTAETFGTVGSPTRTLISSGTFTVNSTVTRYSTQINVPSAATTGLELVVSVGAQISGTWTIGDVQLELGNAATQFERVAYADALLRCKRFFHSTRSSSELTQAYAIGQAVSATRTIFGNIAFPVAMRIVPTATPYSCLADAASFICQYGNLAVSVGAGHAFSQPRQQGLYGRMDGNGFSTLTVGDYYSFTFDADAEMYT